jgi:hypothetical protein
MEIKTKIKIANTIIIFLLCLASFLGGTLYQTYKDTEEERISVNLCSQAGIDLDQNKLLQGFYSYDGYYCVRTDISWYDRVKTKTHEECHALIDKEHYHFCEE